MAFVYVSNAVSGDGFHKLYDWHGWNTTASKNAKGFLPSPPTLNLWLVAQYLELIYNIEIKNLE